MSFLPLQGSNDKVQLQPSPTCGSTGWDYSQRMVKVMCWSTGDPNPAAWFPHCCTDGLFTFSSPLSLYSLLLLRPQGHIKLGRNHRQPTESGWGLRRGPNDTLHHSPFRRELWQSTSLDLGSLENCHNSSGAGIGCFAWGYHCTQKHDSRVIINPYPRLRALVSCPFKIYLNIIL